ncbi:uncharacterized protein LOC110977211 [Acanthaster planci]|uniref:Uncharacterized protein LOC110977211 n=1 Tax=Acanthaster planci TaxID=133434 RepID=A0A8B7Y2R0_ACAPL|nr:uncharacterized protein LOC110977211 [Acanthaster planci]
MSFEELKELGNQLMRAKPPDYEGALSAYSRALTLTQDKVAACLLTNRSLAYLKLNQNEKALEDAELAITIDPGWAKGYWRKCSALAALERHLEVLPAAQDGFKLLKSNATCREFASAWLRACRSIFGQYEKSLPLPTGTVLLSENYLEILMLSLYSRTSTSAGMTEEQMTVHLKHTAEEFQRIMTAFGQPPCHSVMDWVEAVAANLDPTAPGIPVKLLDSSLEKTKQFCSDLSALHVALADIARPLVALAVIVILSRTYVLNCSNTCHRVIQYKLSLCLPIFEQSIMNTPEYIGIHLGTVGGFLDSFVGRGMLTGEDTSLMEEYCLKMDRLLVTYPRTAWEYTELVDISTRIVANVRNILSAHRTGVFVTSWGLPDEPVKMNAEFARRDADKCPAKVGKYIAERLKEVKEKQAGELFIRDGEDLLTLTDVCLTIKEKDLAKEVFELGERVMFTVFGLQMARGVMGLDDAPTQLSTVRQDVMMNALLLKEDNPGFFIDVAVRWRSLLTEFRATLIRHGLGRHYLDTYSNILSLQATGNLQQPYHPDVVQDLRKTHEAKEMEFLRRNSHLCFKAVVETPTAARIRAALKPDEMVLDYILLGEYESAEVDSRAVLGMHLLVIEYSQEPHWFPLDSSECEAAASKWREALNKSVAQMNDPDTDDMSKLKAASLRLTEAIFPDSVLQQLKSEQVKHVYIAPDLMLTSLPLELLQELGGDYVFDTCSVSYISSGRELLREEVMHQVALYGTRNQTPNQDVADHQPNGTADEDTGGAENSKATSGDKTDKEHHQTAEMEQPPDTSDREKNQQYMQTPQKKCLSTLSDNTDCFIIGDPNFNLKDSSGGNNRDLVQMLMDLWKPSSTGRTVSQLLHSREESDNVEEILTMLGPELNVHKISGDDATVSAVLQLKSPFVVHLSSHGFSQPDISAYRGNFWDDTKSAVVLAGYNTYASRRYSEIDLRTGSGMLSSLAISGLDLRGTRLVVLSMCLSGVGSATFQESVRSLADAARAAGAETVVATFWKVLDLDAAEFVKHFYNRLCQIGVRPSQAIKEARVEMRQDPRYAHWYHNSAFACFGYDLPLFPKQN